MVMSKTEMMLINSSAYLHVESKRELMRTKNIYKYKRMKNKKNKKRWFLI